MISGFNQKIAKKNKTPVTEATGDHNHYEEKSF
jgi:hypothetical protein